jgi:hypothetical protein
MTRATPAPRRDPPQHDQPRRYQPLSAHYRRRFGRKVYKVSVSVAQTCPNRQGRGGMRVCSFCDEHGAAAYPEAAALPLREQIRRNAQRIRARYKAEGFLVYFQAYTNTFERFAQLRDWYETALAEPDVLGIVIGTRPDCLPPRVLRLLAALARDAYVGVELGVQTLDDAQLAFLSRGHDAACSLGALERLRAFPELEGCAHLMFGLPGETDAQVARTARVLSDAGVHGVKLHNLHVLRGTPLERLYRAGAFTPIGREDYARRVRVFLEHLAPHVVVHRLNAVASRWDEVVAPDWAREKLGPTQEILALLEREDTWQGRCYPGTPLEAVATLEPGANGETGHAPGVCLTDSAMERAPWA